MRSPQSVTWPYGLGWGGRDLNKKSLLNCANPAQLCQAGRAINICRLTDGYSHSKRGRLRFPSAVDVLLWHIAVGVLHQESHMCHFDFELSRDESLLHTDDFSVPVDDGADSSTPAPSGAPSCFRSSIRTRVCQHYQCSTRWCTRKPPTTDWMSRTTVASPTS